MYHSRLMSLDADVLKVLADPLRAQILQLLAGEALCTCHLVEETGAKQTNVSNHLKVLREAGFVDTEPCGRFTYYRLRPDALRRIADSLNELADRANSDARRPC
ncbi:ArsR family transcriptional regulator [Lentzea albidocapillata subsp. violacea]|uniref:ArsR family transcriptional regulator n=2 Tax=Lentzea albidocapillata TaxID=40571 RepID=A0A1G9YFB2_9PSEU|nr:ArsR family transcriptional regulator [Lentzea albidocapillata subsp. violacea]